MRTLIGSAVYVHEHPYLPTGRIFSPTKEGEDPRLFDGDHLRPEVRAWVLEEVGQDWDGPYPDWPEWATVYLAGGEASHWYGSGAAHGEGESADDFDVLVAVDFDELRRRYPELAGRSPAEIAAGLTQYFRAGFDRRNERAAIPGVDGVWGATAFVNQANSRDIRVLHPYAAYDISDDQWAVRPVETPEGWSAASFPEWTWDALEGLLHYIDAIRQMPEPLRTREGAHLFDDLHSDRSEAFGPEGEGVFDPANVLWKALDLHPSQPLDFLVDCKHRHGHEAAWRDHYAEGDTCACCDGSGEHACGHECTRCDACGRESEACGPLCVGEHDDGEVGRCWNRSRHEAALHHAPELPEGVDQDSMMVALRPPDHICQALAVEGGEPVSALHLTLAAIKDTDDSRLLDELPEVVAAWAELHAPFTARVQGHGTFANEGSHVLWASVDAPGLHRLQADLADFLQRHGYPIHDDHGYVPHVTLAYERHHVRFLPKTTPMEWVVDEVWACRGSRWESAPLAGRGGEE